MTNFLMNIISFCNRVIEYSFYALFLLVPLAFTSDTHELFEFNKMWFVFALTLVVAGAWAVKMVLQRSIAIQKTPLDIPIVLFLLSQIVSTFFSLDTHVSLWGYYTRFNGGLLSLLSYIFLYYAFVSNFLFERTKRLLLISLFAGLIVALWGLPSHFGYDPTCLIFRGNFDVSCWTDQFQPKTRIFSTLGQPNWLAAYLAILIPIALAFFLQQVNQKNREQKKLLFAAGYLLLTVLFYIDLIYTGSRSGFLGLVLGLFAFFLLLLFKSKRLHVVKKYFSVIAVVILPLVFFSLLLGTPLTPKLSDMLLRQTIKTLPSAPPGPALETGGTESGKIRFIVWKGAVDIWRHNPLFGTGVETFAFAYYKYRPVEHNMTSEWDYLYNKAHNEYLNYLATTGIFGLGGYVLMLFVFLWIALRNYTKLKLQKDQNIFLSIALVGSYIGILVSNFLGFSTVMINLYLFLIPAFVFILEGVERQHTLVFSFGKRSENNSVTFPQWIFIFLVSLVTVYLLFTLYNFWQADKLFALGSNLDRVSEYQRANDTLKEAVAKRPDEPEFQDELAYNSSVLAFGYASNNQATEAATLAREAINYSNKTVVSNKNNMTYWKTRAKVFYTLSQIDKSFLQFALQAMKEASRLAPTDARISYNLGVLYGQTGDSQKAIETFKKTVQLKPDYRDAYYALGLFYHTEAVDKNGKVVKPEIQEKAVVTMQYILENIATDDAKVKEALKSWKAL